MRTVNVGRVRLGPKPVKTLVSLEGATPKALCEKARELDSEPVDILEWRVDSFRNRTVPALKKTLSKLREATGKPLLVTVRTCREGGKADLSRQDYKNLLIELLAEIAPNALDVEFGRGDIASLVAAAHEKKVPVIASFHDFSKTPSESALLKKLARMENGGADVLKIAVMPKTPSDVLRLLKVLLVARKTLKSPIVAIAMGQLGTLTRIAGGQFGSCATFAGFGKVSAPGQLDLHETIRFLSFSE